MRILYFTQANLLLRRAHTYNIVHTADAIGRASGVSVLLASPLPAGCSRQEAEVSLMERQHMNVQHIKLLFRSPGALFGFLQLYRLRREFDVVYVRNPRLVLYILFARMLSKKVALEVHRTPKNILEQWIWNIVFRNSSYLIFITHALMRQYPAFKSRSIVALSSMLDEKTFSLAEEIPIVKAREKLNLPQSGPLIVYTGNTVVYDFRPIFEALRKLPEIQMVIVGVTNLRDMENTIRQYSVQDRVILVERVHYDTIPLYLRACDIAVVPFVGLEPGAFPVKIFDYMRAGKPIISFRNDAVEEVLTDKKNALVIDPTPEHWCAALQFLLGNPLIMNDLARCALQDAEKYTWMNRGALIGEFLKNGHTV